MLGPSETNPMKYPQLSTSLVAALVGGGAAAFVTLALSIESRPERGGPSAYPPGGAGEPTADGQRLTQRIESLEGDNRALRARVEALESRPAPDARQPVSAAQDPAAATASRSTDGAAGLSPAVLQQEVEHALASIRSEERAEAEQRRVERESARMEQRLQRLTEQLALSPHQVADMRAHMLAQDAARQELERMRDEGADRETYRSARDEQREAERAQLARILSAEQLQALREHAGGRGDDSGGKRGNASAASSTRKRSTPRGGG